ncbi:hypothetical protein Tco_0168150 [Tanacetum coccineum]
MLAIFSCLETFGTRYRYHPPKFVSLQTELKPPWEPCDTRFKTMSLGFRLAHEPGPAKGDPPWGIFIINGRNLGLKDKAVFQDRSIDTILRKLTISNRYITMVLLLLAQMPPTSKPSTPPTIEESMARLADSLDKLELIVKHLAESTANLVLITSQTTITETTTDHVITAQNTPTVIMPPPGTKPNITLPPNNRQQFLILNPNKTVANNTMANKPVVEFLNLSIMSITNIQHEVDTHTGVFIPTFIKTMLAIFSCLETFVTTKATTVVSTITKTESNDHITNNFHHPSTTHDTQISPHILCAFDGYKPSTLATDSNAFSPVNQPLLLIPRLPPSTASPTHKPLKIQANLNRPPPFSPTAAPHAIVIRDQQTIFTNLLNQPLEPSFHNLAKYGIQVALNHIHSFQGPNTFHPDRQSPPKFVFLQTGHEPPWQPCDPRYKIMILEDKARFEAMCINTCMKVKNKSQAVDNLTTP